MSTCNFSVSLLMIRGLQAVAVDLIDLLTTVRTAGSKVPAGCWGSGMSKLMAVRWRTDECARWR